MGDIGGHARESDGAHVRLRHMKRGVHDTRRAIRPSIWHAAIHGRLRVSRMFGSVGRIGTIHRNLGELLVDRLFWSGSMNTRN